jgi:hypothetical protein
MDLYQFQKDALRTESVVPEININKQEFLALLNAYILISEALDAYKKKIFYNKSQKYDEVMPRLPHLLEAAASDILYSNKEKIETLPENISTRGVHGMLGILTESGELASILQKYVETGEIDIVNLSEELADGAGGTNSWYGAVLCDTFNIDPNDPPAKVIRKLKARYPDKYSDDNATNRNLEAERKELES